MAVKRNNFKIVQFLLQNPNIDVGIRKYHNFELYNYCWNSANEKTKNTALQLAKSMRYGSKHKNQKINLKSLSF